MDGYRVIRETGIQMTSAEGTALLVSLFGADVASDDVDVFPFEIPARGVMVPHLHTADVAAWITEGRLAFGFGEGFADRVEVGPGDLIWLRAREPHAEEAVGGESVAMVIAHIRVFDTEPA